MILQIFNSVAVVVLIIFIIYKVLEHYNWKKISEAHYTTRFVEGITKIYLNPPQGEDDSLTDDPVLRRALGKEKKDFKEMSVRVTIDLEEVVSYTESTSSAYSDEKTPSDCIIVCFRSGDEINLYDSYDVFQQYFEGYLAQKRGL